MSQQSTPDLSTNQPIKADFRSDTVTIPTTAMKMAMVEAKLGDDVMKEDPTMTELEEKVAELCGKEAGLFVPTLTMGNQISARVHSFLRKDVMFQEVIVDKRAHMYCHELGGLAIHSRISPKPLVPEGDNLHLTAEQIEKEICTDHDFHTPYTTLLLLENPLGGTPFPLDELKKIRQVALDSNVTMHMDGARVWNSVKATGVSLKDYLENFDSGALCLSKGLGSLCGAVIIGDQSFIDVCREVRKSMGGGMRQAGMMAAAGIYAIDNHWDLLVDDHKRAASMASKLRDLGIKTVDNNGNEYTSDPETNIVFVDTSDLGLDWKVVAETLKSEHDVIVAGDSGYGNRLCTHFQISGEHIDMLIKGLSEIIGSKE